MEASPLAVYQSYLDKGELAYQWSPAAKRAVFYPRLVCPYSGSTDLEWRIASGLGRWNSECSSRNDTPWCVSVRERPVLGSRVAAACDVLAYPDRQA